MISIRLFLLVLLTLGCREVSGDAPEVMLFTASLAALGVSLGFGLLFKASAISVLSAKSDPAICNERFFRSRQRLEATWILALPAALLATGWGTWLNAFERAGMPQSFALLGWFLPSGFLILLIEMTAAQFDELQCDQDRAKQFNLTEPISWIENWKLRLRVGEMAGLLACVAPVFLIALLGDVATVLVPSILKSEAVAGATVGSFALVLWLLPIWLGGWMGVKKLPDGPLRQRILEQLRILRLRGVEPMLLQSGERWAGAAVVGWIPRFRQLWLGDGLIHQLTERQLDMVVMHELAHITRRHFLWRTLPIFGAVAAVVAIWILWPAGESLQMARNCVAALVASGMLLAGLGTMARACELDADQMACQLAERSCEWAHQDRKLAAHELGNALSALTRGLPAAASTSWLHPSLSARLSNLQRSARLRASRV